MTSRPRVDNDLLNKGLAASRWGSCSKHLRFSEIYKESSTDPMVRNAMLGMHKAKKEEMPNLRSRAANRWSLGSWVLAASKSKNTHTPSTNAIYDLTVVGLLARLSAAPKKDVPDRASRTLKGTSMDCVPKRSNSTR